MKIEEALETLNLHLRRRPAGSFKVKRGERGAIRIYFDEVTGKTPLEKTFCPLTALVFLLHGTQIEPFQVSRAIAALDMGDIEGRLIMRAADGFGGESAVRGCIIAELEEFGIEEGA